MHVRNVRIAILALLATLAGCSQPLPNEPSSSGLRSSMTAGAQLAGSAPQGSFFPLAVGNRWTATADDRFTMISGSGGTVPADFTIHSDITRHLVGTEVRNGRVYVVQEEDGNKFLPTEVLVNWLHYRQDASGLYLADLGLNVPPGSEGIRASATSAARPYTLPADILAATTDQERAAYLAALEKLRERVAAIQAVMKQSIADGNGPPGGLLSNEIPRLRYPLYPGSKWVIRADPRFESTVEAIETLSVPAGRFPCYRIRIDSEFIKSGESARFWVSRSGEVAERYHFIEELVDADGNTIGFFNLDHELTLQTVSLLSP
jgi:hypothetical protein